MTEQRKADIEAKLAELKTRSPSPSASAMEEKFNWLATLFRPVRGEARGALDRRPHRGRNLMMTRLLILTAGLQPSETRTFELPERPSDTDIADLVELVIGVTRCEHVSVLADFAGGLNFKRADMFVDEMGHPKGLPRNEAATMIYRRNALLHQGVSDPETLHWIAGAGGAVRTHRLDVRGSQCERASNELRTGTRS